MNLYPLSVCRLLFLLVCCVLVTVWEADATFVPGRCLCPQTRPGVGGKLKGITVYPKSPSCNRVTLIVTLERNNEQVCLNPDSHMGKQLIHCWNRSHLLGRNVRHCLRRKRRRGRAGQRRPSRQKSPSSGASSSN